MPPDRRPICPAHNVERLRHSSVERWVPLVLYRKVRGGAHRETPLACSGITSLQLASCGGQPRTITFLAPRGHPFLPCPPPPPPCGGSPSFPSRPRPDRQ